MLCNSSTESPEFDINNSDILLFGLRNCRVCLAVTRPRQSFSRFLVASSVGNG